ncbi:MAG: glycoside hydrolase N-terminal domain-containing protein [Prolixibacteraceae bacterium]|nr:glycoside hydrolase N-terminal domain-containing protein [Prolixibacteraceae bacterium]
MKYLTTRAFHVFFLVSVSLVYPLSVQSANSWIKLNDTSNAIYYSKGWNINTQADYSDGTCYQSGDANATATFFFNGTKGRFYGVKSSNGGLAEIYVDNVYQNTVDTYSSIFQSNAQLFETPELTNGSHSIKIVVKGTKNKLSSGVQVVVDGFGFFGNDIVFSGGKNTYIKSAATRWQDALVSANGLLGAMDFCDPLNDKIVLNHNKFAYPDAGPQLVPDLSNVIEQCKDDNLSGNYLVAANRSYNEAVAKGCKGYNTQGFHPGCYLKISLTSSGTISNYKATLNYETGEITTKWTDNNGNWERKTFVSRADNVIVTYLTKPSGGSPINCQMNLDPNLPKLPASMTFDNLVTNDFLNLRGKYNVPGQNAGYEGVTKVITSGGTKSVSKTILNIADANSVLLLSRLERYKDDFTQWDKKDLQAQLGYIATDYDELLARHCAVYTPMFNRVSINLNGSIADRALSSEDLMAAEEGNGAKINEALLERMFYSGLYIYISNSGYGSPRLSTLNLGAWGAAWSGDWTTDANTNLQVSAGNILNQPESMEAYFSFFERQFDDWKVNARNLLGCRGIMAPVRTDGEDGQHTHFFTGWPINFWTSGADWLLLPFCEYYEVTGDEIFLRNRLYSWLKELGFFYEDFLNRTDKNGRKVFALSWSPENTPANSNTQSSVNATMDIAAAKHALSKLIEYSGKLGLSQDKIPAWTALLNALPPYLVATDGALKEWSWPSLQNNYNHRHISQLYPVFATQEINKFDASNLFEASKKAIDLSGLEDGSAFGYCYRALSEAKLYRGDKAYGYLSSLMKNHFIYHKSLMTSHYNTNVNDIYCSDMACSVPTMVTEMLVNTKPGMLELLPALPAALAKGSISGVKGRNRVTITKLDWDLKNHQIKASVISDVDQNLTVHIPRGISSIKSSAALSQSKLGENARVIKLQAGVSTTISVEILEVL